MPSLQITLPCGLGNGRSKGKAQRNATVTGGAARSSAYGLVSSGLRGLADAFLLWVLGLVDLIRPLKLSLKLSLEPSAFTKAYTLYCLKTLNPKDSSPKHRTRAVNLNPKPEVLLSPDLYALNPEPCILGCRAFLSFGSRK